MSTQDKFDKARWMDDLDGEREMALEAARKPARSYTKPEISDYQESLGEIRDDLAGVANFTRD